LRVSPIVATPLCLLMLGGNIQSQSDIPVFYTCGTPPQVEAEVVGMTLCDGQPTDELSLRANAENLQVREGALVFKLDREGISNIAGLQKGDLIYRVGSIDVADAETAVENLGRVQSQADTVVNFLRGGRPYRIKLRRE
jgi:S1-C subfamily serine protease